nr:SMP-30/gluconolactonase/LRE family protein [Mesobacillus harenae]
MRTLELVIDAKASLGEGSCWDNTNQLLYWVDILEKKVNLYNPATGDNRVIPLDQSVGAIVPRKSGGAVVALEKGFHFLNFDTEEVSPIFNPEEHMQENRFNDGKCDPSGRFWAGTMDVAGKKEKGALYCVETDLNVSKKLTDISISNGLAWSPDHKYMYFIDTPTKKVVRFNYGLETGRIENPLEIVRFSKGEGNPDGMTIDEEGMLWIAHWGGARVSRWNPSTGEQLTVIPIPALNVTSCTFGGSDLSELYITTARTGLADKDLAIYPNTGGVFKIKPGVKGLPAYKFKG